MKKKRAAKKSTFPDYQEAHRMVRDKKISSALMYIQWVKENELNMPQQPQRVYADNGWESWYVFLGKKDPGIRKNTGMHGDDFISIKEASKITQKAGITTAEQYVKWKERPINMPLRPDLTYKKRGVWKNWMSFLGKEIVNYEKFKAIIKRHNIKTWTQFENSDLRDKYNLPKSPYIYYKMDGYKGFKKICEPSSKLLTYKKACEYLVKKMKDINKWSDFEKWKDRPEFIPSKPPTYYKDDWVSWKKFLTGEE